MYIPTISVILQCTYKQLSSLLYKSRIGPKSKKIGIELKANPRKTTSHDPRKTTSHDPRKTTSHDPGKTTSHDIITECQCELQNGNPCIIILYLNVNQRDKTR